MRFCFCHGRVGRIPCQERFEGTEFPIFDVSVRSHIVVDGSSLLFNSFGIVLFSGDWPVGRLVLVRSHHGFGSIAVLGCQLPLDFTEIDAYYETLKMT